MEHLHYLEFSAFPGIGPAKFKKLLERFGDAKAAWTADKKALYEILGDKLSAQFFSFRQTFSLEVFAERLAKKNIYYITWKDTEYPEQLKAIPQAPFVLYVKGNSALLQSSRTIGIVGTRKVTQYGKEVTEQLARELV